MNLHSLYGLECIINRFIKYLQCCGHAERPVLRQLWLNCYLFQQNFYTSEMGVSDTPRQNPYLKKTQASQMGCEQWGGKKEPQSCWAYVSFNSLIQAKKAGKQSADKGWQGAFRSVGRNAFWISKGRSQLVKITMVLLTGWTCRALRQRMLFRDDFWKVSKQI